MSGVSDSLSSAGEVRIRVRLWRLCWMIAAMTGIGFIIWSLLRPPHPSERMAVSSTTPTPVVAAVRAIGRNRIAISDSSPLFRQISVQTVHQEKVSIPLLRVSGSILARVRPGTERIEDRLQFSSAELSTAYADWLRTKNEITFAESQLKKTEELAVAETAYREAVVARLRTLLKTASIPEKDYKQAQAELLKAQLQGEKDVFTAQSTLRTALNSKLALERQLSQDGIEPIVLDKAVDNMVLIVANVPEIRMSLVHERQACEVEFYGFPDIVFPAHVEALSSLLTQDRRMLRVLFDLKDTKGLLRPGMFGEVSLRTDRRETLLVPADAVLHIGLQDYVLVEDQSGEWRVTDVEVGELFHDRFEVLSGLKDGARIIANGVILLKPAIVQSLEMADGGAGSE